MSKLLLGAAAVVASFTLCAGVAAAQTGDVNVDASGPGSYVKVDTHNKVKVHVENTNKLRAYNSTAQSAATGDAKVSHNTTGGDATTGDAHNKNSTSVSASVDNSSALDNLMCGCDSGSGDVTVDASGPDSKVKVDSHDSTHVTVDNYNNLKVDNSTAQTATTGNATVKGNTTGGDATTGDATNENSTSVSFTVVN